MNNFANSNAGRTLLNAVDRAKKSIKVKQLYEDGGVIRAKELVTTKKNLEDMYDGPFEAGTDRAFYVKRLRSRRQRDRGDNPRRKKSGDKGRLKSDIVKYHRPISGHVK